MGKKTIDTSGILEFIKSSKEPVNKKQILEATGYKGDYKYAMSCLVKDHEEIEVIGGRGKAFYKWNPKKELYSEMKNSEGYPDGTAGKAIANVMRSSRSSGKWEREKFGEFWSSSKVVGSQEGYLVLAAAYRTVICAAVYPEKMHFHKDGFYFTFADQKGHIHYASLIHILNKADDAFSDLKFTLSKNDQERLKTEVGSILGVSLEPRVEERTVEVSDPSDKKTIEELEAKIKEVDEANHRVTARNAVLAKENLRLKASIAVPGAVTTVEYRTDPKEIEMEVLKAKCDIYEKLVFGDSVGYISRLASKVAASMTA